MRVAALTTGSAVPSARFRVRQHIAPLKQLGIDVIEHTPFVSQYGRLPGALGRIRLRYLPPIAAGQLVLNAIARAPGVVGSFRADITWIERNFVPGLDAAGVLTKGPRVLDVDDAIWLTSVFGVGPTASLARKVDAVIAGNNYLAGWYSQYCQTVFVVPTAIDCERFRPRQDVASTRSEDGSFVIGWTGTAGNLKYLQSVERPLARFLRDHPGARLKIIADQRPSLPAIGPERIEFHPWTPNVEVTALQEMDVGLMPLEDNEWTRGKCSFKMLQYMATGLPVVVSPVGMNRDVLALGMCGLGANTEQEWLDALIRIYDDDVERKDMGRTAREVVVANFSLPVIARNLEGIFRTVASGR